MIARLTLLFAALSLALPAPTQTPGTPGPRGPLPATRATEAQIKVEIIDGIASVETRLVLHHDGPRPGEADWIMPLPEGAVADGFKLQIGEAELDGEVCDSNRARQIYQAIVRRNRDPGLLEYAGSGCLRARVFPIPPGGDAIVKIRWRQVLPVRNGLVTWEYPTAGTGIGGRPAEKLSFTVDLRSSMGIRSAISPTPNAVLSFIDEHRAMASFETAQGEAAPKEFALYYGLSDQEFGLHALAHREAGEEPGYFALLLSPKRDWDEAEIQPRSITFVLDVSGSMRGEKIRQAKAALRQFLNGLRPIDRFDVVPFSTAAEPFFGSTVEASAANLTEARERVDKLRCGGATNLSDGLEKGLPDRGPDGDCLPICVLLSDGRPTAGWTSHKDLIPAVTALMQERKSRVFVLGVGYDLDTILLDEIARANRGARQYVRPEEDIEDKASDLFAKIGKPVLTDLALTIEGARATRLSPFPLPDLFEGSQLVITGRYDQPGEHRVTLSGRSGDGETRSFAYQLELPETETAHDFVPSLWATRRVASLLDNIRLHGRQPELLEEVQLLGIEFQIVTPYTSHLVVEDALGVSLGGPGPQGPATPGPGGPSTPGPAGPATGGPAGPRTGAVQYRGPGDVMPSSDLHYMGGGQTDGRQPMSLRQLGELLQKAGVLPADATPEEVEKLAKQVATELRRSAGGLSKLGSTTSGQRAVDDSAYLSSLLNQPGLGSTESALLQLFVRRLGDKVFALRSGIWTDRSIDPDAKYADRREVTAFSDQYFALLEEFPTLTRYLSLSDRMKLLADKTLITIHPPTP